MIKSFCHDLLGEFLQTKIVAKNSKLFIFDIFIYTYQGLFAEELFRISFQKNTIYVN